MCGGEHRHPTLYKMLKSLVKVPVPEESKDTTHQLSIIPHIEEKLHLYFLCSWQSLQLQNKKSGHQAGGTVGRAV